MPMLFARLDYNDIAWIEREFRPRPIDHDAPPTEPEQQLSLVVNVPMRASTLVEGHSIEAHSFAILSTE